MNTPNLLINVKKKSALAAAALLTGTVLATSGGAAFATEMPAQGGEYPAAQGQMMQQGESQAATELRVGLNGLLREHVSSSLSVTRSLVDHASEAQLKGAKDAQYANSNDLSMAIGSIYGAEAQAQFKQLFDEHIMQSNMYAEAVANGDESGKAAALAELKGYLNEIANFFSTAIPGLPAQDVYGMLNEHEELINKSTEAYAAHDYVQSYQIEREALKQISGAADALAGGIIKTQPEKF